MRRLLYIFVYCVAVFGAAEAFQRLNKRVHETGIVFKDPRNNAGDSDSEHWDPYASPSDALDTAITPPRASNTIISYLHAFVAVSFLFYTLYATGAMSYSNIMLAACLTLLGGLVYLVHDAFKHRNAGSSKMDPGHVFRSPRRATRYRGSWNPGDGYTVPKETGVGNMDFQDTVYSPVDPRTYNDIQFMSASSSGANTMEAISHDMNEDASKKSPSHMTFHDCTRDRGKAPDVEGLQQCFHTTTTAGSTSGIEAKMYALHPRA
ncbi:hypothetical protein SeMB42_g05364 [Synchytrium endobioticum]|uniref:Copper transporter n=1 Tax=Synchytrium endobioticum TaxID=286115 RepID=A0A507CRS7_9FUNG|nr:hypothetical protein SeMB42_g05364 [Synchytrium endobioticum]